MLKLIHYLVYVSHTLLKSGVTRLKLNGATSKLATVLRV